MPDKKVTSVAIICLALLIAIGIYRERDYIFNGSHVATIHQGSLVADTQAEASTTDDWKKLLTTASASSSAVQILTQSPTTQTTDNNTTAQLAKNFFALYLQDQKNGVPIDQNEADAIAQEAISGINVLPQPKQYSVGDIKISADTSTPAKQAYNAALAQAIVASTPKGNPNATNILNQSLQSQNQTDLDKLQPIITGYQNLITATLKISVPKDTVGNHIVYLNTISSILTDLQFMKNSLNDPIEGYVAFTAYQKDSTALNIVLQKLVAYVGQ